MLDQNQQKLNNLLYRLDKVSETDELCCLACCSIFKKHNAYNFDNGLYTGNGYFCSKNCFEEFKRIDEEREIEDIDCEVCNRIFPISNSYNFANGLYEGQLVCSKKCYEECKVVDREPKDNELRCKACNRIFPVSISNTYIFDKKWITGNGYFCSKNCFEEFNS